MPKPSGTFELGDLAGRRQELAAGGVLGVDADLDAVAALQRPHLVLRQRQRLAGRHADLPLDEVDAGDHLGDRVLDLQAGVHLEEEEVAVLVDELDGAGVVVADGLGRLDGGRAHGVLDAVGQARRRRLLDQLLVAALRRAVAGRDPHDVAVGVADDLHLDVARPRQVALDVDLVAPEEVLRLALGAGHRLVDLVGRRHDLHAPAAAAERGLDGDRPAVLLAERPDLVGRLGELGRAGHDRRAAAHAPPCGSTPCRPSPRSPPAAAR